MQDVADNLHNVLNTRKGCGSAIPGFGFGEYERAPNTHDAVTILLEELPAIVHEFEPRVREPAVELQGRYGYKMVRFLLTGLVDGTPRSFIVDIDTITRSVDVVPEVE